MQSLPEDDDDQDEAGSVTVTLGEGAPDRLDKALARDVPEGASLSRSRLVRLMAEGAVTKDGLPVTDPKARPRAGETYRIALAPAEDIAALPEDIPLEVVHEDAALIVIDKPAGLVVHPAPGTPRGTLVNALLHHCGDSLSGIGGARRPGIVHRIDKDTTGLLVVAKTALAHQGLAAQFAAHTVHRHYLAVAHGCPDAADPRLRGTPGVAFEAGGILRIASGIERHRTDRQRQAVTFAGGRAAVTRARVVRDFGAAASLLDCWLETGRTHQIRVHLAHAGHGLIGDPVYGGQRKLSRRAIGPEAAEAAAAFPRQALHAATLGFLHPVTGQEMHFSAPMPADLARLLETLGRAG